MTRGARLALLALVALAGLGVFALRGGERGPGAGAPPQPAALLRLERGNGSEPDSLDPQLARMDSALTILRDAYEGLTAVEPGTAESRPAWPSPGR